jgi:hypothetical protein
MITGKEFRCSENEFQHPSAKLGLIGGVGDGRTSHGLNVKGQLRRRNSPCDSGNRRHAQ